MKSLLALTLLALTLACGSSSTPTIVSDAATSIAGTYSSSVATNADLATFVGCTGDLVAAEGLRVIDTAGACATSGLLTVIQISYDWQTLNQLYDCGSFITAQTISAGAISGDRIDGTVAYDYNTGMVERQTITDGAATAEGTVVLRIPSVTVSGPLSGSCAISPPLEEVLSNSSTTGIPRGPILGGL